MRQVYEAWRYRRTAYQSGRREAIGYVKPRFGRPKRKVRNKKKGILARTAMKHKNWRRY